MDEERMSSSESLLVGCFLTASRSDGCRISHLGSICHFSPQSRGLQPGDPLHPPGHIHSLDLQPKPLSMFPLMFILRPYKVSSLHPLLLFRTQLSPVQACLANATAPISYLGFLKRFVTCNPAVWGDFLQQEWLKRKTEIHTQKPERRPS